MIYYPSKIFVLVDESGIPIARPRLTMTQAEEAKIEFEKKGFKSEILEYELKTLDLGSLVKYF